MTRLEEKLKRAREKAAEQIPDDALAVANRHTAELENAGAAEQAVGEGDPAPNFRLPDQHGEERELEALLARGPVILGFYRGRW